MDDSLLFGVDDLNHRLSHGFEGVAADVLHVVVQRVPRGSETALGAVGVEGDDVYRGYTCRLVGSGKLSKRIVMR